MFQSTPFKTRFLSLFVLVNLTAMNSVAQVRDEGQNKIRIKAPPLLIKATEAGFRNIMDDSIYFFIGNESHTLHLTEIRKIEISESKKKNTANGMVVGSLAGTLGLGLAAMVSVSNKDGIFTPDPGSAFLFGGFIGSVLGLAFGAIIGNGIYTDQWQAVSIGEFIEWQRQAVPASSVPMVDMGKTKRWYISILSGSNTAGPKNDIEQAMIRDGFTGSSSGGWFTEPADYPYSKNGFGEIGVPWDVTAKYRISDKLMVGIDVSNTPIGKTFGYRLTTYDSPELEYSVFAVSPVLYLCPTGYLNFGIGPAYYRTSCRRIVFENVDQEINHTKLGIVFDFQLAYPENTLLFVEFKSQYRWIPEIQEGPFELDPSENLSLSKFKADYSHLFIGLGVGIHL